MSPLKSSSKKVPYRNGRRLLVSSLQTSEDTNVSLRKSQSLLLKDRKSSKDSLLRARTSQSSSMLSVLEKEFFSLSTISEETYPPKKRCSKTWPVLKRNDMLVTDHRHFLAARIIQKYFRCLYERLIFLRKRRAAIIIQNWWRRFYAQRSLYRLFENKVQNAIKEYHAKSATTIQANFRGYFVREHIHDQYRLTKMQNKCAEELLHCIAFKLHHLLRTHQIPGVYSLQNSTCFSKIERLLASIRFNEQSQKNFMQMDKKRDKARKIFEKSRFATNVPFTGPNFSDACATNCTELLKEPDVDRKMYKILSLYEQTQVTDPRVKGIKIKLETVRKKKPKQTKKTTEQSDFCCDVIKSMKRWNILTSQKKILPNIFKNMRNVDKFLTEISSIYSMMTAAIRPCYCKLKADDYPEQIGDQ